MKRSQLYRKAAARVANGLQKYSCHAITDFGHTRGSVEVFQAEAEYASLFKPDGMGHGYAWGIYWASRPHYKADDEDVKNCRVLALCFMAAIAEDQ